VSLFPPTIFIEHEVLESAVIDSQLEDQGLTRLFAVIDAFYCDVVNCP
jgi:hypothetical protein